MSFGQHLRDLRERADLSRAGLLYRPQAIADARDTEAGRPGG
jgi:hypothetical protein